MAVLRAVLRAVGLLVVLVLAAAVVGLAVAILAIMVMQGVEGDSRPVRVPVPARRPAPTRSLLMNPAMKIRTEHRPTRKSRSPDTGNNPGQGGERRVNRRGEG